MAPPVLLRRRLFSVRVATVLSDDYLLPNATVRFAEITHGVTVLVERDGDNVHVFIARGMGAVQPILNCYRTAPEVFSGFVKDFVRGHLYKKVADFVPSSTRQGADALFKLLQRNRELYRYEQSELGELEPLLADYLSGDKNLGEEFGLHALTVVRSRSGFGRPMSGSWSSSCRMLFQHRHPRRFPILTLTASMPRSGDEARSRMHCEDSGRESEVSSNQRLRAVPWFVR